jgi:quercetin dioxygenase-like cupin family protein
LPVRGIASRFRAGGVLMQGFGYAGGIMKVSAALCRFWLPAFLLLAGCGPARETAIPVAKLDLSASQPGVRVQPVLAGAVAEVTLDLVSVVGPGRHEEPAAAEAGVVWLVLAGQGRMSTGGSTFEVAGETVARAPQGWDWRIEAGEGETLHALRIRRGLNAHDLTEFDKYPENNAGPLVKKFSECPAYREAIKSPKTISRTLLPENFVPRMALGTVETTGPDAVGRHRHPMLEQFFLGLGGNAITVVADESRAQLGEFAILHIPLGSDHGAEVATGSKLHYVWMDFFMTKDGQEWLKMHEPVEQEP